MSFIAVLNMAGGTESLFGTVGRSTDPNDIGFLLFYDPRMKHASRTLTFNDKESIRSSPFNVSKATKVLIHGLILDTVDEFPSMVKNAYLENQYGNDHNIIVVNWSRLADQNPGNVLHRVRTVGTRVSDFLLWLHNSMGLDLGKNVHLVGHWFGAHLAGMVGKNLTAEEQRLGRITGLDPRDSGYFTDVHSGRLGKTDAAFVDVYHTNDSTVQVLNRIGHVDFYINRLTATPMQAPVTTKREDKNSVAHRIFAQSIIDGPLGNNLTSQIDGFPSTSSYPVSVIVGEYCIPGTNGWFDISE